MLHDIIPSIRQERLYQWDVFYRSLQALPVGSANAEVISNLQCHLDGLLSLPHVDTSRRDNIGHALCLVTKVKNPLDHQLCIQKIVELVQDTLLQEHKDFCHTCAVRPHKRARHSVL